MSVARVDQLDRMGFWRLADLAVDAAFRGVTLAEATADGVILRTLGTWDDGRAIRAPLASHHLEEMPRVLPAQGIRFWRWPTWPTGKQVPPPGESGRSGGTP
jgi:hypothetical protein